MIGRWLGFHCCIGKFTIAMWGDAIEGRNGRHAIYVILYFGSKVAGAVWKVKCNFPFVVEETCPKLTSCFFCELDLYCAFEKQIGKFIAGRLFVNWDRVKSAVLYFFFIYFFRRDEYLLTLIGWIICGYCQYKRITINTFSRKSQNSQDNIRKMVNKKYCPK